MIAGMNELIGRMSALTSSDSDATGVMELPAVNP